MHRPSKQIDFGFKDEVETAELLEKLDIPLKTLMSRVRESRFPKPIRKSKNGKVALYDRDAVDMWLIFRDFDVKTRL